MTRAKYRSLRIELLCTMAQSSGQQVETRQALAPLEFADWNELRQEIAMMNEPVSRREPLSKIAAACGATIYERIRIDQILVR